MTEQYLRSNIKIWIHSLNQVQNQTVGNETFEVDPSNYFWCRLRLKIFLIYQNYSKKIDQLINGGEGELQYAIDSKYFYSRIVLVLDKIPGDAFSNLILFETMKSDLGLSQKI